MDSVSYQENKVENNTLSDGEPSLREIQKQLQYVTKKIEEIDRKQDSILDRVDKIEKLVDHHELDIRQLNQEYSTLKHSIEEVKSKMQQEFDPDVTLVVTNPPSDRIIDYCWAVDLVHILGGKEDMIVNTLRTQPRNGNRGILKIELCSTVDKVSILRNKPRLKNTKGFEKVFVRSSKSHMERLMDLNFKTLLSEIPQGRSYRIAANGRIIKRDKDSMPSTQRIPPNPSSHADKSASTPINSNNGSTFTNAAGNSIQAPTVPVGGISTQKLSHNGLQQRLTSPPTLYNNVGYTQPMPSYLQSQQVMENQTPLLTSHSVNQQAYQPQSMMNLLLPGSTSTNGQSFNIKNSAVTSQAMAPFPNGQLGTGI